MSGPVFAAVLLAASGCGPELWDVEPPLCPELAAEVRENVETWDPLACRGADVEGCAHCEIDTQLDGRKLEWTVPGSCSALVVCADVMTGGGS